MNDAEKELVGRALERAFDVRPHRMDAEELSVAIVRRMAALSPDKINAMLRDVEARLLDCGRSTKAAVMACLGRCVHAAEQWRESPKSAALSARMFQRTPKGTMEDSMKA